MEDQRKRIAAKKAAAEEEAIKKICAEIPYTSSEDVTPIPPVPTIYSATDDQLVRELQNRGYTGNIIKKTSFIL